MRLILIGPPGVGKGTQSALLVARKGLIPLSSGDIFRKEIEAKTDLGRLAKRYIDHGELVPNGVTIEMMAKRLRDEEVRKGGFVLDGFPRTSRQAEALDEILFEMEMGLDKVVSIEVDEETIVARLSGRLGCTKCGELYHSREQAAEARGALRQVRLAAFRADGRPGGDDPRAAERVPGEDGAGDRVLPGERGFAGRGRVQGPRGDLQGDRRG